MATAAPRQRGKMQVVGPQTQTDDTLLNPIQLEEIKRRNNIRQAIDAFNGIFPDSIAVKPGKNQKNFNLKVNLVKAPVRKIGAFLFGQDVGIEVKPVNPAPAPPAQPTPPGETPAPKAVDPAQTYLDEFWEANHKMITLKKAERYGSLTGDCFLKIVVDPGAMYPRLVVVDPQTVEVQTLPDDCDTATAFTITYQAVLNNVLYDCQQRITKNTGGKSWLIQDFKREANHPEKNWQPMNEPQNWQYPFPPLFHCPDTILLGSYHGAPAITIDVIHLNIAYNFLLSNLYKAAHHFGNPRMKGFGFKAGDLPSDPDQVAILPSEKSMLEMLEGKVDFAGVLSLADRLEAALYKLLSVNGMTLGDLTDIPRGQIAALAIQLLFQVLIDLTNERRLTYGQIISDVCSAVLQIAGYGINRRVKLHWPQMLPIDYPTAAQAALSAEQAGVSQQTAIEAILGLDWDIEQDRNQTRTPSLAESILSKFNAGADLPGVPPPAPEDAMPMMAGAKG